MGRGKGGVPLKDPAVREITSDTLLIAELASKRSFHTCIDLGTGTGGILAAMGEASGFTVGIDFSERALRSFEPRLGQPVLCDVRSVCSSFRKGCADLVVANPPYYHRSCFRQSPDSHRAESRTGDPLTFCRFIFAGAHLLQTGGLMVISCRPGQIVQTVQGMKAAGFEKIGEWVRDGIAAVTGTRSALP